MKIYVCVKHVPDTAANIKVTGPDTFNSSVKFIVNPYDEYALEEAISLVGKEGGEVVVVTVGQQTALTTMRSAMAMGATRGILVECGSHFLDAELTAAALHKAIAADGTPDLIFAGKQSVDSEGYQVPYRLAQAFDMAVVSEVTSLSLNSDHALAEREIGGGTKEVVQINLPCVIGATKGLNEPRYPKLPDILKAKKKEIKKIDIDSLKIDLSAASTKILELTPVSERGAAKMLAGSNDEMAEQLVNILQEDKVL